MRVALWFDAKRLKYILPFTYTSLIWLEQEERRNKTQHGRIKRCKEKNRDPG